MTSLKDSQLSSRPLSQHRLSMSSCSPLSKPHTRIHSGSMGSHIPSHRVTRRKSITTNNSVMVAAVKEAASSAQGMPINGRRSNTSRSNTTKSSTLGLPSSPMSLPTQKIRLTFSGKSERLEESAIDDDQMGDIGDEEEKEKEKEKEEEEEEEEEDDDDDENGTKPPQARRASEGQHLMKDCKKPSSSDLKCDKCGKGYKHSSCLSKHLWEHTPEWSYTSKLLISKHQQVQLLEAASVLLTMTQDVTSISSPVHDFQSDRDSTSTSSEQNDHLSSTDTTPPPQSDIFNTFTDPSYSRRERGYKLSHDGQQLSNSYQSASSIDTFDRESNINSYAYEEWCKWNVNGRSTSYESNRNQEDESLASAVQLLSCSFGSTGTPVPLSKTYPQQMPPIPNIPIHYLDNCYYSNSAFIPGHPPQQPESYTRSEINLNEDVKMESGEVVTDDEDDRRSQGRSDEDDEGIFGRMEE